MCGIVSIIGKNAAQEPLEAALDTLSHRGPDDRGTMAFAGATLGQTRLAIIDLSPSGHQPMKDNVKNIAITFNGEIYNYQELRTELESKGHQFSTHSDTEVILKAYQEYGSECPKKLDGMFAFVIWDDEKKTAFMARDRFGKKPLFYAHTPGGTLAVASEIKALKAAGVKTEIDPQGIDAYLTLMYVPPWRTVYKNVHTILGGQCATYKNDVLSVETYWRMERKPVSVSYDEAKEEVRGLFTDAVKKRMVAADVEVGAFLSGGIDSSLVTAYAQRVLDRPLQTFSLGYGDLIDELPFADQLAKKVGTNHRTLQASADLIHEFEAAMAYFDEPHGDPADFPQHLLSQETSTYVKVALSGEGGDEMFLGYGRYFSYWHTSKLSRLRNMLFSNQYKDFLKNSTVFPLSLRKTLQKDSTHVWTEPIDKLVQNFSGSTVQKMALFDITTNMQGQLLTKVDEMGMMHGLEVRCPFLDYKLAEFAFNLPTEYKTDGNTGKLILKDLLAEEMPREFVDRKKQGFGAPVRKWLGEPTLRAYVENAFKDARVYEYLDKDAVQRFIQQTYASQKPKGYYQLWTLLCLEVWLKRHAD
ncbi:asparagine synthase (glutamine-hydrolyzing) [Patescibacteria group bacterium]|nr:asparagine synthase (glutamine-hydrolyzing) [Patescibacteria group bacterium]